jgi:hypothetical protein
MDSARVRNDAEVALPGILVGLTAGAVAGGLALLVGQPADWAAVTMLTLGVPLGLLGGTYGLLIAHKKVRLGGFAPAALFWLIGFPLSRLLQEMLTGLILAGRPRAPADLLGFLAYQGIVSAGFAIGFLWLHERLAPQWWLRVADHNPLAADVLGRYAQQASTLSAARRARRR